MDPIIKLLRKRLDVLNLLGKVWEILYIEGSTPDIGKRRENFIKMLLKEELMLKVIPAPSMEREWDFSVIIGGIKRTYSLKTTESITTVKVAWDGFPSIERARNFEFKFPILYITGNRSKKEIAVFVFETDDLESLKEEMGDDMWWVPKSGTNPRGFDINTKAVKRLMKKAIEKENYVSTKYSPINVENVKMEYWKGWYNLLKKLALRY
ncbi:MAG: hypothetical protein ACTSR0_04510 [Candidatus Asgardarchaeia archaeon]